MLGGLLTLLELRPLHSTLTNLIPRFSDREEKWKKKTYITEKKINEIENAPEYYTYCVFNQTLYRMKDKRTYYFMLY